MPGLRDIPLRKLLDAATPGPWHVDYGWDEGPSDGPGPHGWVAPHGAYSDNRATNQLIALAPELAALCLDMGDYIRRGHDEAYVSAMDEEALLARLDRLGDGDKPGRNDGKEHGDG